MEYSRREYLLNQIRDEKGTIIDPITCEEIEDSKVYILQETPEILFTSIESLYKSLVLNNSSLNPYTRNPLDKIEDIESYGHSRKVTVRILDTTRNYDSPYRDTIMLVDWFVDTNGIHKKALVLTNNEEEFVDVFVNNKLLKEIESTAEILSRGDVISLKIVEKKNKATPEKTDFPDHVVEHINGLLQLITGGIRDSSEVDTGRFRIIPIGSMFRRGQQPPPGFGSPPPGFFNSLGPLPRELGSPSDSVSPSRSTPPPVFVSNFGPTPGFIADVGQQPPNTMFPVQQNNNLSFAEQAQLDSMAFESDNDDAW